MRSHISFLAGAIPLLALAQAQKNNGPVNVPIGVQNGLLHFPIECNIMGLKQVFDGVFTATGPVSGRPGQDTYLTELTSQITIPYSPIYALAPLLGITQVSIVATGNISGINTAQPIIPIFPEGGLRINNISLPTGSSDIVVKVPADGGVLPPVGPSKLGNTQGKAVFFLDTLLIILNLQDKNGKTVIGNIPVTCPQPVPNIQLAVVGVNGPPGGDPIKLLPGPGVFPLVPDNFETGSFRFPYTCTAPGVGKYDVDLSITGTVPTYLKPNGNFSITEVSSFLHLPIQVFTDIKAKYPGATSYKSSIKSFFVTTAGAAQDSYNAIKTPVQANIKKNAVDYTIAIPEDGYLPNVGPIPVGNKVGDTVYIGTGTATASIYPVDSTGKQLADISVSCAPDAAIEFIGFPIMNTDPPVFKSGAIKLGN